MALARIDPYSAVEYTSVQRGLPDARHERHFEDADGDLAYRIVVSYQPRPGWRSVFDRLLVRRGILRAARKTLANLDRRFTARGVLSSNSASTSWHLAAQSKGVRPVTPCPPMRVKPLSPRVAVFCDSRVPEEDRDQLRLECSRRALDHDRQRRRPWIRRRSPPSGQASEAKIDADARGIFRGLAALDGRGDRVIDVLPTSTCALSIWVECYPVTRASALSSALRGDRVAVSSRVSTSGEDFGICGLATVRLLGLKTSAARTLDDTVCGLSGTGLTGMTFDSDGRLCWRLSCGGDQSACEGTRAGPFRQTAAGPQRVVTDLASRISGSAARDAHADRAGPLAAHDRRVLGGPDRAVYRCDTVTAVASRPTGTSARRGRYLPPPGYVTVKGTSRVLVLRPSARS